MDFAPAWGGIPVAILDLKPLVRVSPGRHLGLATTTDGEVHRGYLGFDASERGLLQRILGSGRLTGLGYRAPLGMWTGTREPRLLGPLSVFPPIFQWSQTRSSTWNRPPRPSLPRRRRCSPCPWHRPQHRPRHLGESSTHPVGPRWSPQVAPDWSPPRSQRRRLSLWHQAVAPHTGPAQHCRVKSGGGVYVCTSWTPGFCAGVPVLSALGGGSYTPGVGVA